MDCPSSKLFLPQAQLEQTLKHTGFEDDLFSFGFCSSLIHLHCLGNEMAEAGYAGCQVGEHRFHAVFCAFCVSGLFIQDSQDSLYFPKL